jgi:hypothetical protein
MSQKKSWIRSKLIEIYERAIPQGKFLKDKIYLNGDDNLYPNTIKNLINQSPTAKRCSSLMFKYIVGNGVVNNIDINSRITLNDIAYAMAREVASVYEFYVWVGYGIDANGNFYKNNFKIISADKVRKQIDDDEGNNGKLIVSDWNAKTNLFGERKNKKERWFYPFNDNQNVVRSQILADSETNEITADSLAKYRGQLYHCNLTSEYQYGLPPWDSVFNDMSSEANISIYTNNEVKNGFLGKTIVATSGLSAEAEETVGKDLKSLLGSENSANFWHVSLEAGEKIEDNLKFIQLKPQFDDKLFELTEQRFRRNILGAFSIPEDLVFSNGGLFGNGTDKYNELKKFYWEQLNFERQFISDRLFELGFENVEFKPLYTNELPISN